MGGCGGGGCAYSITAVRTYVRPIRPSRPVRNTNGFRAISFEKIGVLASRKHTYIILTSLNPTFI